MAEADALGDGCAGERERLAERDAARRLVGDRLQAAGRDHLGDDHRRRLQRLRLLLGVGAPGGILDDEDADRVAGPQDRHAEEGIIDLLARLRLVGEARMQLRIGDVQDLRRLGDEADEAFPGLHRGQVDGGAVETLGGIELERAVGAQHIDRADLRHHVGGDQHHDPVEPLLRADRLRHDLAKPSEQHARAAERAAHHVRSVLASELRPSGLKPPGFPQPHGPPRLPL